MIINNMRQIIKIMEFGMLSNNLINEYKDIFIRNNFVII
jgi:hypothetical protein